jgi:hypothetical protein
VEEVGANEALKLDLEIGKLEERIKSRAANIANLKDRERSIMNEKAKLICSDVVNELADLEVQIAGVDDAPVDTKIRINELKVKVRTDESKIQARLNDVKKALVTTVATLEELNRGLFNLRQKGLFTVNPFEHAAGKFKQNQDPTREVYHSFKEYKNSNAYGKIREAVTSAPAFQGLIDKVLAREIAISLTKAKQQRLIGIVTDGELTQSIRIDLPIPGDDHISKEEFKQLQTSLASPIKVLANIIRDKSVQMFGNIIIKHDAHKAKILQTELAEYLQAFQKTLNEVDIATSSHQTPFNLLVAEIGTIIQAKVTTAIAEKESIEKFKENDANLAEASAKMVKKVIAERTDQIILVHGTEPKGEGKAEQTKKGMGNKKIIIVKPKEKWFALPEETRTMLINWNKLDKAHKDGPEGEPLLNEIKKAVAEKILDLDIPWLNANPDNKQEVETQPAKGQGKRKKAGGKEGTAHKKKKKL